jgi:hypothetical protein
MNLKQKQQYKESLNLTLSLFKQGKSMPEIAYKRKLAFSTIETHLRKILEYNKIKLSELLDQNKNKIIEGATINCDSLKEIKEKFPKDISYGEIKYLLTAQGRLKQKRKTAIDKAINIYMGNYCSRKCFNHPGIIGDCSKKFDVLRKSMSTLELSFKEFNILMKEGDIKFCKLTYDNRIRYVSWKRLEYLMNRNTDLLDLIEEENGTD